MSRDTETLRAVPSYQLSDFADHLTNAEHIAKSLSNALEGSSEACDADEPAGNVKYGLLGLADLLGLLAQRIDNAGTELPKSEAKPQPVANKVVRRSRKAVRR